METLSYYFPSKAQDHTLRHSTREREKPLLLQHIQWHQSHKYKYVDMQNYVENPILSPKLASHSHNEYTL